MPSTHATYVLREVAPVLSLACAQVVPDDEEASCISCAVHHGSVLKDVQMTVSTHPGLVEMEELAQMAEVIVQRHAGALIPTISALKWQVWSHAANLCTQELRD